MRSAELNQAVELQPLPSLSTAETRLTLAESKLQQLKNEGASTVLTTPQEIEAVWARRVLNLIKDGNTTCSVEYDLVGHRIDDFVLVGMQGEPFVEIGLATKHRSNASHTMFAGYVNGVLGYVPTAQTVRQGGMAVSSAVHTYALPAPPTEAAVDTLIAGFDELLLDLGL